MFLVSFLPFWFAFSWSENVPLLHSRYYLHMLLNMFPPTCDALVVLPNHWPNLEQNHHMYLWWFALVAKTTANTCGDLPLWQKPPQVHVVICTCGEICHKNHHKGWKSPHVLFSVHRLIPPNQFGAIPGKSTIDTALCLAHDIYTANTHNLFTSPITFNMTRYFNNINHNRLLVVLWNMGTQPLICTWVQLLVNRRETRMRVDRSMDSARAIQMGYPQLLLQRTATWHICMRECTKPQRTKADDKPPLKEVSQKGEQLMNTGWESHNSHRKHNE